MLPCFRYSQDSSNSGLPIIHLFFLKSKTNSSPVSHHPSWEPANPYGTVSFSAECTKLRPNGMGKHVTSYLNTFNCSWISKCSSCVSVVSIFDTLGIYHIHHIYIHIVMSIFHCDEKVLYACCTIVLPRLACCTIGLSRKRCLGAKVIFPSYIYGVPMSFCVLQRFMLIVALLSSKCPFH